MLFPKLKSAGGVVGVCVCARACGRVACMRGCVQTACPSRTSTSQNHIQVLLERTAGGSVQCSGGSFTQAHTASVCCQRSSWAMLLDSVAQIEVCAEQRAQEMSVCM